MATTDVEEAVSRPHWEARHEWESRVKFVEDNVGTHGLEKATNLSFVWANMKFLGCSYPSKTEALVAHYPVPPLDELRARRRCKKSLVGKRSGSDTNEVDTGPPPTKQQKLESNSLVLSVVSEFISSIRTQSEQGTATPSSPVPKVIQDIATTMCLCDKCLGRTLDAGQKGQRVLERYGQKEDKSFTFDFTFDEIPNWCTPTGVQTIGHKCSLMLNHSPIVERVTTKKKDSKTATAAAFVHMVEEWQESHSQPSCPNMAPPSNDCRGYNHPPSGRDFMRGGGPPRPRGGGWRY